MPHHFVGWQATSGKEATRLWFDGGTDAGRYVKASFKELRGE